MKAGRTAMTIHHIGSANELAAALGDAITAIPVPRGPHGDGWATYGDGSSAVFAACAQPGRRLAVGVSYLSTGGSQRRLQQAVRPAAGDHFEPAKTGTRSRGASSTRRRVAAAGARAAVDAADRGFHPHGLAADHAEGAARPDHARRHDADVRQALFRMRRVEAAPPVAAAGAGAAGDRLLIVLVPAAQTRLDVAARTWCLFRPRVAAVRRPGQLRARRSADPVFWQSLWTSLVWVVVRGRAAVRCSGSARRCC